ncbi:helix-turn-helix domain-containing protein [Vagococcus sp. BWB3-3]|uniref:Helix-turn-helix domain-containing protein n=1 Tax=Vagococcus allomyrinae TaxID=2794353 RepID=A0A940PEM9_9ENTE|nr:helix-turn-helix domain-containing protein [Vagococcus allomyrinae]MBP1044626.1 helix-turn-helix domain-containing protein [Vagococcus allomyrinae]
MVSKVSEYEIWRQEQFEKKIGFFPVFSDFKPYMKKLSPGAISLYVYFGLHANHKTGEVFHSVATIANFFNKSPRTISNWIYELESERLIERHQQKVNSVSHTYLVPYNWQSGYLKTEDDFKFKFDQIQF